MRPLSSFTTVSVTPPLLTICRAVSSRTIDFGCTVSVEPSASLMVTDPQVYDSSPGEGLENQPPVDAKKIPELAAWTSVARVLFNLDDFMTRE